MSSIIKKTSESAIKSDKNGKSYKTCTFAKMQAAMMDVPGVGKVAVNQPARETSVNLYAESYLDGKEQFGYSIPAGTEKQSFLFGDIVTRTVKPYTLNVADRQTGEITSREVSTFTAVVFGDSSAGDWETRVRAAFRSRGHELIDGASVNTAEATMIAQSIDLIA